MLLDQKELKCKFGHIIPAHAVVIRNGDREESRDEIDAQGKKREMSLIACEQCAMEASSGMAPVNTARRPMLRGSNLELAGQAKIEAPMIFVK